MEIVSLSVPGSGTIVDHPSDAIVSHAETNIRICLALKTVLISVSYFQQPPRHKEASPSKPRDFWLQLKAKKQSWRQYKICQEPIPLKGIFNSWLPFKGQNGGSQYVASFHAQ